MKDDEAAELVAAYDQRAAALRDWYALQCPRAMEALKLVLSYGIIDGRLPTRFHPDHLALVCDLALVKLVELELDRVGSMPGPAPAPGWRRLARLIRAWRRPPRNP